MCTCGKVLQAPCVPHTRWGAASVPSFQGVLFCVTVRLQCCKLKHAPHQRLLTGFVWLGLLLAKDTGCVSSGP